MPLASWLFLKDDQSIWVERPYGTSLIVAGPGKTREQREFVNEAALDQFQMALAERLVSAGWFLWGVNRERRERNRLEIDRPATDRRAPLGTV